MAKEATETRTVQSYRHDARDTLSKARARLKFRTETTGEIYHRINGAISSVLAGQVGLTQEAQVERLTTARDKVAEGLSEIPALVAKVKEEFMEGLDQIEADAKAAQEILDEAATFAAERDFEQWQKDKARRKQGGATAESVGYDSDDEEDDDDE